MTFKNQFDTAQVGVEVSTSARRVPVQERSQHTVQRVLDAASSLLQQMPLEDVTTTRIATEAGLSIGALYRFFPDKQTITDAIAVRHVEQFRASLEDSVMQVLERELANLETFDPAKILDGVVDAYIVYLDAHPDFRTISFGRYISAATKERQASPTAGLPALLKNFMLERLGIPNTPELDLMLRIVIEAGERLIAYAYEQPTRADRDRHTGKSEAQSVGRSVVASGGNWAGMTYADTMSHPTAMVPACHTTPAKTCMNNIQDVVQG